MVLKPENSSRGSCPEFFQKKRHTLFGDSYNFVENCSMIKIPAPIVTPTISIKTGSK
jgi:hypothetical protein